MFDLLLSCPSKVLNTCLTHHINSFFLLTSIIYQMSYLMPWPGSWDRRAEPRMPRQSTAAGTPPSSERIHQHHSYHHCHHCHHRHDHHLLLLPASSWASCTHPATKPGSKVSNLHMEKMALIVLVFFCQIVRLQPTVIRSNNSKEYRTGWKGLQKII